MRLTDQSKEQQQHDRRAYQWENQCERTRKGDRQYTTSHREQRVVRLGICSYHEGSGTAY